MLYIYICEKMLCGIYSVAYLPVLVVVRDRTLEVHILMYSVP